VIVTVVVVFVIGEMLLYWSREARGARVPSP
jgi:hypothetical protein